jgi:3-hydroxy-9,10-secoandrosta-1,3,5(10)-triene-9,17-dione monooxygenase
MLAGMVQSSDGTEQGGEPERRLFMVHRDQYEVLDTWYVSGLKATGSADVTATDQFIPECLTVSERETLDMTAPGLDFCTQPLFRFPIAAAAPFILVAVLHGAARGTYDDFVESIRKRVAHATGRNVADFTAIQSKLAEAGACLDASDAITRRHLHAVMDHLVSSKDPIKSAFAAKLRRDASFCSQLCVRAIDLLFAAAGGTALYEKNHIERAWRDVHAGSAQIVLQWDMVGPAAGRVELGLPSGLAGV